MSVIRPPRIELVTDDNYTPPYGSLCLGHNGWLPEVFELLSILSTDTLERVLDRVLVEYQSLLGPGELVFATTSREGTPDRDPNGVPCLSYKGFVIFVPEDVLEQDQPSPKEISMKPPEIPPGTPANIVAFIETHWADFTKIARVVDPDSVLITWMDQANFCINAAPREKIIAQADVDGEPETIPEQVRKGPLPLEPGAVATLWLAIYSQGKDQVTASWCSASFFPDS